MKLIGAKRTGVQSLGRHNVNLTGMEGDIQKTAAITDAVTGTLNASARLSIEAEQRKLRRQTQQADLYMQKVDNEFWKTWGNRDFFDVDELPEDVVTDGMKVKGRIASAEVLPLMYKDFIDTEMPNAALIVENENARIDWSSTRLETALARQQNIQTKADGEISRQILEDQKINYKNAIEQGRPDVASIIADDMDTSDEERKEFKRNAREKAETILYERLMIQEDVQGMKGALDFLKQKHDKYAKENGELDDSGRLTWINKLKGEIHRIETLNEAADKTQMELTRRQISITTANSKNGKPSSAEELVNLHNKASILNTRTKGGLSSELASLNAAIVYSDLNNSRRFLNRNDREKFVKEFESKKKPGKEFEFNQISQWLDESNKAQTALENKDFMKSVQEYGIMELNRININEKDPQVLAQQLNVRLGQFYKSEQVLGEGIGKGPFTNDEAIKLSGRFNMMPVKEKITFMTSMGFLLGRNATDVYEQLRTDGTSSSFTIAGLASINGQIGQAEAIIRGNEYRRKNPEEIKKLEPHLRIKINKNIGKAFWQDPNYENAIKESIIDAYVFYANSSGKDFSSIETGGFFSEDLFQKAIDAATGGMVEHAGLKIPAPEYGMQQDSFDDWIETLSPKYIDNTNGKIDGLKSTDFLRELENGNYKLVSEKQGQYVVTRPNGVPLMHADGPNKGMRYILKYNPNAPKKKAPKSFRSFGNR